MTTFQASSRIDGATNQVRWNTSYAAIPRPLLRDPSFAKLKGNAVKLLLAMLSGYIGNNNGELIATFPVMKTYGFNSKDAVAKALSELLTAKMIIRTRLSDYRLPATYAVTWLPVNKPGARGPYDAHVSPSDVAVDSWRLPKTSTATTPLPAPSPGPDARTAASAPTATRRSAALEDEGPEVAASATTSTAMTPGPTQPYKVPSPSDLVAARARLREMLARRKNEAAEKQFYEDRKAADQRPSA